MTPVTTHTTFGTVTRDYDYGRTTVTATGDQLRDWAHRGDCSWPLSGLAKLDAIAVVFASNGDLIDYDRDAAGSDPIYADELNAWTSETLIRAGYPNHPAIRSGRR